MGVRLQAETNALQNLLSFSRMIGDQFYHEFCMETQRWTKISQFLLKLGRPNFERWRYFTCTYER